MGGPGTPPAAGLCHGGNHVEDRGPNWWGLCQLWVVSVRTGLRHTEQAFNQPWDKCNRSKMSKQRPKEQQWKTCAECC